VKLLIECEDDSTLDLRGCLKSPDSVKFDDYTRSFQLPNTWAESYARTVSVEISGLFKHPLRIILAAVLKLRILHRCTEQCRFFSTGDRRKRFVAARKRSIRRPPATLGVNGGV
jgi:hypothetical protein